jgi:recombination protein RecR
MLPESVQNLIREFAKLPGIGMKTAARLTFFLLNKKDRDIKELGRSIIGLKSGLKRCRNCFNITEQELCSICQDSKRDQDQICVVETPLDVVAIEKGREYRGLYHILDGAISPVDGIGPEQLRIKELLDRVKGKSTIKEVILATNPDLEGEATALYIQKKLGELGSPHLKISRIAKGLPVGGDLEYADEVTIKQSFENRQSLTDS